MLLLDEDGTIERVIEKAPPNTLPYKMLLLRKFEESTRHINWKTLFDGKELVSNHKKKLPLIQCNKYKFSLVHTIETALELYPEGVGVCVCPFHEAEVLSCMYKFEVPCETVTVKQKGYTSKYFKLIRE